MTREGFLDVRRLREMCHFTQEELAAEVGVTPASVSRWECGHSRPRLRMERRLLELWARSRPSAEDLAGGPPPR